MKRLISIFMLCGLLAMAASAQEPRLSIARCDNVILPGPVEALSFSDEVLYLRIPQLLLSSHKVGGRLQSPEGDVTTRNLGEDVSFVARNPVTGYRYFTTRSGKCYREVLRPDKDPKLERVSLPHFSGSIVTPTFSSDGRWMLFASDARDGRGGLDLWATCSDSLGEWLAPIHLDATVNGEGDESSPVLIDGFLLFASPAQKSQELALYSAPVRFSAPTESEPLGVVLTGTKQMLPPPINGSGSNYSIVLNGDASKGFWLSTRDGEERLYQFEGNLRSSHVCGVVTDTNHHPLEGVRVTLRHRGHTVDTTTTLADGSYHIFLQFGRSYDLYFSQRDYFTEHVALRVPPQEKDCLFNDLHRNVVLSSLQYDTTFYFYNIFGNDAEEELSAEGRRQIEPIVRFLRENPHVVAAVSLRTDLTHDAAYNRLLGQHRIESLKSYITSMVANPDIVFYNDCDYDGGCKSASSNAILAIILRTPDKKW